jgi:hypothetical protein
MKPSGPHELSSGLLGNTENESPHQQSGLSKAHSSCPIVVVAPSGVKVGSAVLSCGLRRCDLDSLLLDDREGKDRGMDKIGHRAGGPYATGR